MVIKGTKYNSITEAEARIAEIKIEARMLVNEAQQLQRAINDMNDCNYQSSTVNQTNQY
mgnify:CR=1 FL=1